MNRPQKYADKNLWRETCRRQKGRYYAKTAIYRKRAWTEEEDAAVMEHAVSDTQLSSLIQRSVRSIQCRRSKLTKAGANEAAAESA